MSSLDGEPEDQPSQPSQPAGHAAHPDPPPRAPVPGTVQVAAILLYVGGALTVVSALAGLASGTLAGLLRSAAYLLIGLLYLGLARAVQRGRRWARRAVLVLCGLGVALAAVRLIGAGVPSAAGALAWPVVYAILLNTATARSWFRAGRSEAAR